MQLLVQQSAFQDLPLCFWDCKQSCPFQITGFYQFKSKLMNQSAL